MNIARILFAGVVTIIHLVLGTLVIPVQGHYVPSLPSNVTPAAANCVPGIGTATITGTVRSPTAAPVQYVQVELYTGDGTQITAVSTNATGTYSLTKVLAGSYLVRFKPQSASGAFLDEWYNNAADQTSATPIVVTDGSTTSGVNATLELGGRIGGRVTAGDTGNPLSSVQVLIYDASNTLVANVYTDASGNYLTSPGLPTGSYKLYFVNSGGQPYLSEYYNNQGNLATADVVAVTAPTTRSGINAALALGARIRGRVTDAVTGAGIGGASVTIYGDEGEYIAQDYTDATGYYSSTAGLSSGTYTLVFRPISDTSDYIRQTRGVTVTAPNVTTGVNAALPKGGRLTGRVTDSGGNPLPNTRVRISDLRGDYQRSVSTNATGIYTAYALPTNSYFAYFRPSDYLEEVYNDQSDPQLAQPIAVTAPNTTSGIDAVLINGGVLAGKVTAADGGAGLDDVRIEIYDRSGDRLETIYTGPDGRYTTQPTLRGGSYQVKFIPQESGVACGYVPEVYNDRTTLETGDLVTIMPPNTTEIDAVLEPGSSIQGRVTAPGGVGIQSVYVTVYNSLGEQVATARTNAGGTYRTLPALPSGTYRIEFSAPDTPARYLDEFYNDKPTLAGSDLVTVNGSVDATDIDATLGQGGAISGQITAADTALALEYVSVTAYNTAGQEVAYTTTDSAGRYTTGALPNGNYRLHFVPYDVAGAYLDIYSGAAATLETATTIGVTAPNITANVNAALSKGATIAGLVTAVDTGNPLADVEVVVYNSNGEQLTSGYTGQDGRYTTYAGLRPGAYRLQFNPYGAARGAALAMAAAPAALHPSAGEASYAMEFYNDQTTLAAAEPIIISDATNRTGIDATLAPGSRISGSVAEASTGARLPGIEVQVYDASGHIVAEGYTGATGTYVAEPALPSGAYRVGFVPPYSGELSSYAASFYNSQGTLGTATPIQLTAPTNRSDINGVLAKGGQLSGQVAAPGGAGGQSNVEVTVYNSGGEAVATAKTNGLGIYKTRPALAPGTYRVGFTPPSGSGFVPSFYQSKRSLAQADPVNISTTGVLSGIDDTLLRPEANTAVPTATSTDTATAVPTSTGIATSVPTSGATPTGGSTATGTPPQSLSLYLPLVVR